MSTRIDVFPTLGSTAAPKRMGVLSFLRWLDTNYRTRQKLARLDPQLRRDIGLSDARQAEELERPSWDIPTWWR